MNKTMIALAVANGGAALDPAGRLDPVAELAVRRDGDFEPDEPRGGGIHEDGVARDAPGRSLPRGVAGVRLPGGAPARRRCRERESGPEEKDLEAGLRGARATSSPYSHGTFTAVPRHIYTRTVPCG